MKINFRQGIIRARRVGLVPNFLTLSGTNVGISITTSELLVTAAYSGVNYIIKEGLTVPNAWPILAWRSVWGTQPPTPSYHLYWDINTSTGRVTRNFTHSAPIVQPTTPVGSFRRDQHWFDKTTNIMKIWNGSTWTPVIRVFAGQVTPSVSTSHNAFGSHVGITNSSLIYDAGFIAYSTNLNGIRLSNGTFLTSADDIIVTDAAAINLENNSASLFANEPIPALSAVTLINNNLVGLAYGSDFENKRTFGIAETDAATGESVRVRTSGYFVSDAWNWDINAGKRLYCGEAGALTQTAPINNTQQIATIISSNTINIDIDITSGIGGVGDTGLSGFSGYSGPSGGASGFSGFSSNVAGTSGFSGFSGNQGTAGATGSAGASGFSGFSGATGPAGSAGTSGFSGFSGPVGTAGSAGASGFSGYSGTNGTVGPTGASGFSGFSGPTGSAGTTGPQGTSGFSGFSGPVGTAGSAGASGFSGFSGQTGSGGASGFSGFSGINGTSVQLQGSVADFASLPLGATAGDLYITLDTGDGWVSNGSNSWSNVGPIQGPAGATGSAGASGFSGFSGPAGSTGGAGSAGASGFSGFSGSTGGAGSAGASGFSGFSGPAGSAGTAGTSGFSGFSGQQGNTGSAGSAGASGFSGFSGPLGTAGASGFSGFSGPQGLTGTTGSTGTSGFSGFSGPTGVGTSGFSGFSGPVGTSGFSGFSSTTPGISGFSGFSGPAGAGTSGFSGFSGPAGSAGASGFSGFSGAGVGTLGAGVQTFLTTPSSANLRGAVTDETGTGALVFNSSPTITGIPTFDGAQISALTAMGANVIDVTKLNSKSISADTTFTFSATAAAEQWFTLYLTNTDTASHVITIPSSYSTQRQGNVTSFVIPASYECQITWRGTGSTPRMWGEPAPDGFLAEQTIASAGTTDIGAASSINISISGTTTITSLGTVAAGTYRQGRFTGALTFTHNATSLILPNNATNITTAANDRFGAISLGSGNWLVLWYQRASGSALQGGAGASGFSGFSGPVGTSGFSGFSSTVAGTSGFSGFSGPAGAGTSGFSGFSSTVAGVSGFSGFSGPGGGQSGFSGFSSIGTSGFSGFSGPAGTGDMILGTAQTVTASKTFNDGTLILAGSTSGNTTLKASAVAGTTTMTLPAATDTLGYLGIPIVSNSADYTAVIDDAGKCLYHPSADTTARTFTIPANASVAYPVGTTLMFENDAGAGALTIAITSDTLVLVGAAGTTGSRTLASGGRATALKVTSTRWRISGTAELT